MSVYRQSTLASFETCPLRCKADLALNPDPLADGGFATGNVGAAGDLGSVIHAVLAEILRTLGRQGESQMPTQEAIEVMREVYSASDVVLPSRERDDLRWMVLRFCDYRFNPSRILAIEQRLEAELRCPDGVKRTLVGRPDLLMAEGQTGIIIVDYKSGRGKPPAPRKPPPEGEPIRGKQYLSERGHYQLDSYGLLALRAYPAAEYALLRELHLRSGEIREATLGREELEHVEVELAQHMEKLDRAQAEGDGSKLWTPRPGRHCLRQCPVIRACPIPVEQRGEGALATEADADKAAQEYVVTQGLRDHLRALVKAWHEETGHAPDVGDGNVMRWNTDEQGKRRFDIHEALDNNGKAAADDGEA